MRACVCGNRVANNARTCPKCGHRFTSGTVKAVAWFLGISVGLAILAASLGRTNSSPRSGAGTAAVTDSKGRPVSRGVTDDAELLLTRCGAPSKDDSSEHDDPRPPVPSRVVEYQRYKLRFIFIPGAGRLGDPPPYQWRLVGITDTKVADASKARVVSPTEAANRMHCWTGN